MITVLFVDAGPNACPIISPVFESCGQVSVIPAGSGEEALAWLSRYNTDVIVSDFALPGMTGIELLRALRAGGISLPFILFSRDDTPRVRDEAYREDVFGFIAQQGLEKRTVLNLLRLVCWAAGGRETEYPFSRELQDTDVSRPVSGSVSDGTRIAGP